MFSGEAPESDDEILALSNVKLGKAQEITEIYSPSQSKSEEKPPAEMSLLQKCLGNI